MPTECHYRQKLGLILTVLSGSRATSLVAALIYCCLLQNSEGDELFGFIMPLLTKTCFVFDDPIKFCGRGVGFVGDCSNLLLFASKGERLFGFISISE